MQGADVPVKQKINQTKEQKRKDHAPPAIWAT
jgi:hypothetical protein